MNWLKTAIFASVICNAFISDKAHAGLIDLGVDLGVADKYTIGVGQWDFHGSAIDGALVLGSEAYIHGNVAASGRIALAAGAIVYGDACATSIELGASAEIKGAQHDNGDCDDLETSNGNVLDQLSMDILAASNTAKNLTGVDLGAISASTTFDASTHNVITLSSLNLGSDDVLHVTGSSTDNLIVNILGNAQIASGAKILLDDGLTSANVLFNFVNDTASSLNFGGAELNGTFLATKGAFNAGDGAILNDVRFFTNYALIGNFQTVRTKTPTIDVPEPSTVLIILAGLCFLLMRSNSKHN